MERKETPEQLECLAEFDKPLLDNAHKRHVDRKKPTTIHPLSLTKYVELKREQIVDGPFSCLSKQSFFEWKEKKRLGYYSVLDIIVQSSASRCAETDSLVLRKLNEQLANKFSNDSKNVEIVNTDHGYGLRAVRDLKRGTFFEYVAVNVSAREAKRYTCSCRT